MLHGDELDVCACSDGEGTQTLMLEDETLAALPATWTAGALRRYLRARNRQPASERWTGCGRASADA